LPPDFGRRRSKIEDEHKKREALEEAMALLKKEEALCL